MNLLLPLVTLLITGFCIDTCTGVRRVKHEISTPTTTGARIVFPGQVNEKFNQKLRPALTIQENETSSQIPVSIFLKNPIKSTQDFIHDLIINKDEFESAIPASAVPGNVSIFMRANSGVRTGDMVEMAQCEPQLTPVELEKSSDPSVIYYPSCTRVERCGGCCNHDLLACEPTKIEILRVKVIMARYQPGEDGFKHEGFKHLELEKHSSCDCRCKTKEEDCNPLQEYHPNECKCVCRNEDEIERCTGENRFWNPITCECLCRHIRECSTGFYYDTDTCSCIQERNAAPVYRVPSGFNWRNPPQNFDVSWGSDRARRNQNNG